MSFSDAIGQVDQIVQWEQQLGNPAALTPVTSSGGTATAEDTSSTSASGGAGSSSFSDMLAQAQAQDGSDAASLLDPSSGGDTTGDAAGLLGGGDSQLLAALTSSGASGSTSSGALSAIESALQSGSATGTAGLSGEAGLTTGLTGTTGLTPGLSGIAGMVGTTGLTSTTYATATSADDPRIEAMTQEADSLLGKPYVWGGGHSGWGPQSGYDCSGFVSAVLHAGGYLASPADTTTLPGQAGIAQGPGQYVTIYDRDRPGQEGHVIIQIDGQFYESGGEQGSWGGGGGVQKISTPSAAYLATFNQILHPEGL